MEIEASELRNRRVFKLSIGGITTQRARKESRKIWAIAAPAILTEVSQFSIGFITMAFIGHLGDSELAAVSVIQNVFEGFVYGIMLGMGSALETLCGQAVGAGQVSMLGIYMQRSFIITLSSALILVPFYIFASPLLKLLRQNNKISELAGQYSLWVIPQLFAYAFNFPIQKFLQAQSRIWIMAMISVANLGLHVLLNWVLVVKFGRGLLGAAIAGNITWWLVVLAQMGYVLSGAFSDSWTGFSFSAFKSLYHFLKLSLASAVMSCLELWYYALVILMVGWLKNSEMAVDAVSICTNLQLWALMIALGFNAAVSVRVSNELGAQNPETAEFSAVVAITESALFGTAIAILIVATRRSFPDLFTGNAKLAEEASNLGYFLAATIFLNSIQVVLHGIAVGAGWQFLVALINVICYFIFGLPCGSLLGYKLKLGAKGIWCGMLSGYVLQAVVLAILMCRTNWQREAAKASKHVSTWSGSTQPRCDFVNLG